VTSAESLPSHSLPASKLSEIATAYDWPVEITPDWAWGGSTGRGARVCVLDSGIERGHSMVGELEQSVAVERDAEGSIRVFEDDRGDLFGHGTAVAGIVRSLAPDVAITSVRVLGEANRGSGEVMMTGLRWAVDHGFDVINMSLSTTKRDLLAVLHELTDAAYFRRSAVVAAAHNMALESYPWRFSSVLSVGTHEVDDPMCFYYNPAPPVEFYARGLEIELAWRDGGTLRASGNSFAAAHISAIAALVLAKHPQMTPFELKSVLRFTAANAVGAAA
jgi:subtilisin family serine protease